MALAARASKVPPLVVLEEEPVLGWAALAPSVSQRRVGLPVVVSLGGDLQLGHEVPLAWEWVFCARNRIFRLMAVVGPGAWRALAEWQSSLL